MSKFLLFLTILLISFTTNATIIKLNGSIEAGRYEKIVSEYESLVNNNDVTLNINSPGGLLSEMYKISKFVEEKGLKTHCEEICYSAAGIIFLKGKKRTMNKNAVIMIHEYKVFMGRGYYSATQLLLKVLQEQKEYDLYISYISELLKIKPETLIEKINLGKEWFIDYKEAKKLKLLN